MESTGALTRRLYELLRRAAAARAVADIRIGSVYLAVQLDDGRLGLSAVPALPAAAAPPPRLFREPRALIGARASRLLAWLPEQGSPWRKALALAAANALIRQERSDFTGDALASFKLTAADRVVMVGRFSPLLERIAATGAALTVLEKDPAKGLVLPEQERRVVLRQADVAIVTATTILYDSLEEILGELAAPRHVSLLGPSTPMLPELFAGAPITHLGGVKITATAAVLSIVAAGGGTRAMRPFLEMTNLFLRPTLPGVPGMAKGDSCDNDSGLSP